MGIPMRTGRLLTVLALLCVLMVIPVSRATATDSLLLRTGELFSGTVLRITRREVSIQLASGGILSFRRSQVQTIRRWLPGELTPEVIELDDNGDGPTPSTPSNPPSFRPYPGSIPIVPSPPPITRISPSTPGVPAQLVARTPEVPVQVSVIPARPGDNTEGPVWSIKAPQGFERIGRRDPDEILRSWVEPISQAAVLLAHYEVEVSAEEFKKQLLATYPGTQRPHLHRDLPLNRDGEGGYRGWIVELEQVLGGSSVRQLHLYAKSSSGVFVLRCTAPSTIYSALSSSFEESLHSFRIAAR